MKWSKKCAKNFGDLVIDHFSIGYGPKPGSLSPSETKKALSLTLIETLIDQIQLENLPKKLKDPAEKIQN